MLDSNSSSIFLAVRSWTPDPLLPLSLSFLVCTVRAITLTQGLIQCPIPHPGDEEPLRDPHLGRLTVAAPERTSEDEVNLISMVCPHIARPDILEEAGLMLELVEVDRGVGTWGGGEDGP